LYDGAIAEVVTADMSARGGLLTREDLATYRPVERPALAVRSGLWELRTNPPPAIGGAVLAALLTLLGDRPRAGWTDEDIALLATVQRQVLGYRRDHLDVALDREAAGLGLLEHVTGNGGRSPSTVHVSVVDSTGSACAITASSGYGSGATVPGTGIWLNNCLGEHELNRGDPLRPGERLASNMAPTVGRSDDGSVLAIGSPGADRITTALAQVLAAFANGRATLQEAIDAPRLHVNHLDDVDVPVRIEAEQDMPLPDLGLPVRRHHRHSMFFGGVSATYLDPSGQLGAAGDPRRSGATAVGT
jgi:gamma-glutamyltranspeptidase/glutathione hydrolase